MVDIIIPAYNCSKTLPKTLASICAQTKLDKCIVTIIDDCSTEDLSLIIQDFKKHFNIKLQYIKLKENLGYPGLVRQVGLEYTNAPYVMFVDSDDYLDIRAVELANQEMRNSNNDVLIGYFFREDKNKQWQLLKEESSTWLHGNVYKREFLEKNNISFSEGLNEDGAFNTQCYMLSDKIGILSVPMYYWTYNVNSLTRNKENFTLLYAKDFISTLRHAYLNIISHTNNIEKVYMNLGTHLAFSYKLYNNLYVRANEENEEFLVAKNAFFDAIKEFVFSLQLSNLSEDLLIFIKKGFIKGYTKYIVENAKISPNDFFKLFNIKISLKIEDFKPEV